MARREKCDNCGQQLGWDDEGVCWTCTQEEVNERAGVRTADKQQPDSSDRR